VLLLGALVVEDGVDVTEDTLLSEVVRGVLGVTLIPPVILEPVIGIGSVSRAEVEEDSNEEVAAAPSILNSGEALPDEPMRTTI